MGQHSGQRQATVRYVWLIHLAAGALAPLRRNLKWSARTSSGLGFCIDALVSLPLKSVSFGAMTRSRRRKRVRGRRGGRPHRRSVQAAERRAACAQAHFSAVCAHRVAGRAVRRVYLGGAARLVFSVPFPEGEAPAVLRDATFDIAGRLRTAPHEGLTTRGSPDVKVPGQKHHCRHRWRLLLEEGPIFLSLSTHHHARAGRPTRTCGSRAGLLWCGGSLRCLRHYGLCFLVFLCASDCFLVGSQTLWGAWRGGRWLQLPGVCWGWPLGYLDLHLLHLPAGGSSVARALDEFRRAGAMKVH